MRKAAAGLPHSISAGDEDEALRLRSWDGWPPAQSWRVKLRAGDDAISQGGRPLGVSEVRGNLLRRGNRGVAELLSLAKYRVVQVDEKSGSRAAALHIRGRRG